MKTNWSKLKIFVIISITIISTLLIENFINKYVIIKNETQIIKGMSQSENEENLQTQINVLNASHKEYATNVQAYKKQIVDEITKQGVNTSENATAEVISENISKILQARTSNATATEEDIAKGKTAWINGELITGNANTKEGMSDNIVFLGYCGLSGSSTFKRYVYNPNIINIEDSSMVQIKENGNYTVVIYSDHGGGNGAGSQIYVYLNSVQVCGGTNYGFLYEGIPTSYDFEVKDTSVNMSFSTNSTYSGHFNASCISIIKNN